MEANKYNIKVSGSAPWLYPTNTFFGLLWYEEEEALEIPKRYPYQGEWGEVLSTMLLLRDDYPIPKVLSLVYLSLVEKKFYGIEAALPDKEIEEQWAHVDDRTNEVMFSHIVIGMAPYGKVAIWVRGFNKSMLVGWLQANEVDVEMADFLPNNPSVTLSDYCSVYISNDSRVKDNLAKNGLPSRNLFDNYMKQFSYRYLVFFEQWKKDEEMWENYAESENVPIFDYIEESLYDGTHDKLHDGGLMKYHQAGKPKKLRLDWHIGKSTYSAYFWFEGERMRDVFDRFYGAHPETKTDFIIRIDAEKRKYELTLYRYGLKEPQVIPEDVYQLLVFKNKFEDYRSENYDQKRGAWIW